MLRIAETKLGLVEGLPAADPRITSFKGIPFAKPPVGDLRFHAPVPAEKWEGTLKAYNFSPIAVQPTPYYDPNDIYCREWSVDKNQPMSEDCLYLNVWTPAMTADEKLPVYFWIYGGGFQTGFSAEMEFDGERIARRGIVVVTINYRLNMFGFMCHPEITAENPDEPANFGLLDQRMALQWVKDNIAAFGGDSENITIGGQSAGGGSVLNQIAYGTKGLFKRAVVHSGMIFMEKDNPMNIFEPKDLSVGEEKGVDFFKFCGNKSLKEMRQMTTAELRQKWDEYGGHAKSIATWLPIKDGKFIKDSFCTQADNGTLAAVPLFIGYTKDEFCFPDPSSPTGKTNIVKKSILNYFNTLKAANIKADNFFYEFDVHIPGWDNPGTFHSVDLWFWFETLAKCWRPFKGVQYDIARQMCNYMCNFIKNGDPNGKDCDGTVMPEWPAYSDENPVRMHFIDRPELVK